MELAMVFDAVEADGVRVEMEEVGNGRLGVEAVLHVHAHPRCLGTVPEPRVAALVDAVDPFEIERVALARVL